MLEDGSRWRHRLETIALDTARRLLRTAFSLRSVQRWTFGPPSKLSHADDCPPASGVSIIARSLCVLDRVSSDTNLLTLPYTLASRDGLWE